MKRQPVYSAPFFNSPAREVGRRHVAWGGALQRRNPRYVTYNEYQARECGRQRLITDTFHHIQYRSLPKIPRIRLGKTFSDDALSVARCNPVLSQRLIG